MAKTEVRNEAAARSASKKRQLTDLEKNTEAFEGINVEIVHAGRAITLPSDPANMPLRLAHERIGIKLKEEEQDVTVNEQIDAFPFDGAVAFHKAMQRMFGWTSAVPTPGFFGPTPPATREIPIAHNKTMTVIWSRFELPGVQGFIECDAVSTPKGPRFVITGIVKRKDHETIRALGRLTRQIADEESIYRGKAIKLQVDSGGDVQWDDGISFVNLDGINREELIFSELTETQISTSLWTPIEHTELCRQHKIPLKRGILLEGKYGTGKTLTSAVTAMKAVENGWTFLTINRVAGLDDALHFARKFQPCVIFAEDIDRSMAGGERTAEIDDILNTIDGIESKNSEIFVVLTTNHIEKMNRAMLRPGRLDAIVTVTPPDAAAVKKLVTIYGRTMLAPDATFDKSAAILAGQIPAMIREAVERSKLYAINRGAASNKTLQINDDDLYAASMAMEGHRKLLEGEPEAKREPSLREIVENALGSSLRNLTEASGNTHQGLRTVASNVSELSQLTRKALNEGKNEGVMSKRQGDEALELLRRIESEVS